MKTMTRTLDLRKVFGMIVTYTSDQKLNSPEMPFDVVTELIPGGESAIHSHPNQDETYEVREGEIELFMNGEWKKLKPGDSVTIPKGTVHGFRNTGNKNVVAFNRHNPGLRFGEMLEVIQQKINEGKITSVKGFRNLAYMSSIMMEYSDVMNSIKPPASLIKMMARLGKTFGYK